MAASLQLDLQSTGSCSVPESKTLNPKPKALNPEAFRCVCCMWLQGQTRRLKPRSYEVGAKVVPKNISFVSTLHFIGYVQRRLRTCKVLCGFHFLVPFHGQESAESLPIVLGGLWEQISALQVEVCFRGLGVFVFWGLRGLGVGEYTKATPNLLLILRPPCPGDA